MGQAAFDAASNLGEKSDIMRLPGPRRPQTLRFGLSFAVDLLFDCVLTYATVNCETKKMNWPVVQDWTLI